MRLLMTKPLFWTSVISLCISMVATIVLVALCVCRRRRPATRRHVRRRQIVQLIAASDMKIPTAARQNGMVSLSQSSNCRIPVCADDLQCT